MSEALDLAEICALLLRDYGIDPARGGMVRTLDRHVRARLERLGLDVGGYVGRVRADEDERQALVHAMTVNHSWFFRDPKQLEALGERMLELHARAPRRPLEIWVAGCASGQEAWTVAMIAAQLQIESRVLATDIDLRAIETARQARYGAWNLRELPPPLWDHLVAIDESTWTVSADLRERVEFARHNLCGPMPERAFDVVSCRNVLIYFEPTIARRVVVEMRACLHPDGELVLGAGDLMFQPHIAMPRARLVQVPPTLPPRAQERPRRTRVERSSSAPPSLRPPAGSRPIREPRARTTAPDAAREVERSTPALDPEANLEVLERAGAAVARGNTKDALPALDELVARDPLLAEAHLWVGIAHHTEGRDELAGEALRRVRCLQPELWPGTLFAALNHERRGRWQAAARCWVQLDRLMNSPGAPPVEGTAALRNALPDWQAEARALAKLRHRTLSEGTLGPRRNRTDD